MYREENSSMYVQTIEKQCRLCMNNRCTYIRTRHFPLLLHDFSGMK
jgi:hypothetical protein